RSDLEYDGTETLDSLIDEGYFLADDSLLKHVFLQIVDGVEFLHKRGIFPRDIKSENILVDEDWTVRIEEPGVSTARHVHPCRKYAFMSPGMFVVSDIRFES
ncbi:hypothetical protein BDQ17DRAFT_1262059, partial [Cyathus striatus]